MNAINKKTKNELSQKTMFTIFTLFALTFGVMAFFFNSPQEIWEGLWLIMISPATLLTDYIELANPGAALMNVSLMTLETLLIIRLVRAKINGPAIAGIFIIVGFAFFGKNFYNSLPIIIGAFTYAKITRVPLEKSLLAAIFGTALSPLVSELSFAQGLSLPMGIFLGYMAGFIAGFIIPPLAQHAIGFTKGFSLHNIGFTVGLIAIVFTSFMRNFGRQIETVSILSSGNDFPLAIFLLISSALMIVGGLLIDKDAVIGLKEILSRSGQLSTDYIALGGVGATFLNMGLLGFFSTLYVLFLGGDLNGPMLGGIFCIIGFGAFGNNIKTVIPVMLGATFMSYLTVYNVPDTGVLLAILFVTALAPIAGHYGLFAGLMAGALHLTLVVNVGAFHGGISLYNNGLAAGFVAAILVPLFEAIDYHKAGHEVLKTEVDPADKVIVNENLKE